MNNSITVLDNSDFKVEPVQTLNQILESNDVENELDNALNVYFRKYFYDHLDNMYQHEINKWDNHRFDKMSGV